MTLFTRLNLRSKVLRHGFIFFILLLSFTQTSLAQARSWSTVVYSGTREAWVYLPPNYNTRTDWPVVIFLHGQGERGTDPNMLLVTGLPKFFQAGNDLEAVVICPQIPANLNSWQTYLVSPARNYVLNNYQVNVNKVYITGLSLGATGAELYTNANPSQIAASLLISGSYVKTGLDASKDVPRYFVHGNSDVTQNITNAIQLTDSLNERSPKPILPPLTSFHFGMTHSSAVWDGVVYDNFDPWFKWLRLHDKNADTTALHYVDSLTVNPNFGLYWRALRLVNSLSSSTHKSNLLSRMDGIKAIIYGSSNRRVLMDLGLAAFTSPGNINNLTDLSSTAPIYTNLIDDQGVATPFFFDQVSESAGTEERDYGIRNSYFAGLDEANGYRDAWWIYGNGGTTRLGGLDTSKTYTVRMSGSSKNSSLQEQGVRVTIGGVEKTINNQFYNTTKYIEYTNLRPNSSGHIDMAVRSYATTNQWDGYIAFIELVEHADSVANIPPVANAGTDITITLPVDSVVLSGSGSDADGTISTYAWALVSGPGSPTITLPSSAVTSVYGLSAGQYLFALTVTDNLGADHTDTVEVTVHTAANIVPVANAGTDLIISLPTDSVTLTGTGTDADGMITAYEWGYVSGPAGYNIVSPNSNNTVVNGLVTGVYLFALTVTDDSLATASDTVQVTVNAALITQKKIQVSLYGGTNAYNHGEWNDWNIGTGAQTNATSGTFTYTDTTSSTVYAVLSNSVAIADNGASYGGTVCPPQVLRYNSYNSSNRSMTLHGLTPGATYDLEFYASRSSTGNTTIFTINGISDSVVTDHNKTLAATISGVTPNVSNQLVISIRRGASSTWQYLNGFTLTEHPSAMRSMRDAVVAAPQLETVTLSSERIYPNPVTHQLTIQYDNRQATANHYTITDITGKVLQHGKLNIGGRQQSLTVSSLAPGMYLLQLLSDKQQVKTFKFVKQ